MRRISTSGRAWAIAVAALAIVAILAGVYAVRWVLGVPGRTVEAGREIVGDLKGLAAAFRQGTIETTFISHATRLAGGNKLIVAELDQTEIYARRESNSVLWGTLKLPEVVVEARVPVEYVYFLDLADAWEFELRDRDLRVRAPRLRFSSPALDVSRLDYEIRASSVFRDEDAAIAALQAGLTELSRQRAREHIPIVRETARRHTEVFVRNWLSGAFENAEVRRIDVVFADEPLPGEDAALGDRRKD